MKNHQCRATFLHVTKRLRTCHVASKYRVEDMSSKRLVKMNIPSVRTSQCHEPPDLPHKGGSFFCTALAESKPYYVRQTKTEVQSEEDPSALSRAEEKDRKIDFSTFKEG